MTGTFNKQDFTNKLHYTMLFMLSGFTGLCEFNDSKDVSKTINFLWNKALQTLWQTRLEGVLMIGIDKTAEFESFCAVMQLGINQLNTNINSILTSDQPAIIKMTKMQAEMKEMAVSLTDDICNLLNPLHNETAA